MDLRYTILPNQQLLRVECTGLVTPDKLIAAMKSIAAEPGYRPLMPVLADFRPTRCGEWDYSEIQRLRDYVVRISRQWDGVRWAVIVQSGNFKAMAHTVIVITEALDAGISIRLFEDPSDALPWLQQQQPLKLVDVD